MKINYKYYNNIIKIYLENKINYLNKYTFSNIL